MRVWRVVVAPFAVNAFSGDGARLAGGRWNPKGVPVVYAASSLALATLLINPKHPDFTRITWASPQPLQFDARLRK